MPWWNASLASLRSRARAAYKTWSRLKTPANKVEFKECKASYQRELRREKRNSFKLLCANSSDKEIFSTLRSLSGKKKTTPHPSAVEINGSLATDPTAIIAACATHFFPSPLPSDDHHAEVERGVEAVIASSDPEPVPPITFEELQLAVQSLNRKAAPGLDGLNSDILMSCFPAISSQLLCIMNSCFQLNSFPEVWKKSKVLIIGKPNKESYNSLNSFRPITLVNSMSKTLEKLILNRLTWLARTQSWLCDSQHGFREGRSTETAAHSLVSCIESAFTAKESAAGAFLDIKSAFDSAWHPAILAALAKRSCPVYLIKLVKSFLQDRQATISLGASSSDIKINLGCPQGGVLSPFLWILLIDDALRVTFDFPFRLVAYADDLTAITWHKDPAIATQNLQRICDFIMAWCKKTKLTINALKTVFMIFSRRQLKQTDLSIKIGSVDVAPSSEASFLGFLLDPRLTWHPHVNLKTATARRAMLAVHGCLRATWGQDSVKLRHLYSLVVEPILLYGCSVWASFIKTKSGIKRLRSFQRFVNRLITRSLCTAPTDSLLILSNTIPIEMRVVEITGLRYACHPTEDFATSSILSIARFLPAGHKAVKLDRPALPYLINLPPWKHAFSVHNLLTTVELCPPTTSEIYLYVAVSHERKQVSFVLSDSSGCLVRCFTWKCQSSARLVVGSALGEALKLMPNRCGADTVVKLFSYSFSLLSFMRPGRILYEVERKNLEFLSHLAHVELCVCDVTAPVEGLRLAVAAPVSDDMSDVLVIPPDKETVKRDFRSVLVALWSSQWQSSNSGSITRRFFPTVDSAITIRNRPLSSQLTQILTGHCFLNAHMHRFNLTNSPICGCGQANETVDHFLFVCPAHAAARQHFYYTCVSERSQWPPSLPDIGLSSRLWSAMGLFIRKSSRLVYKRIQRSRVSRAAIVPSEGTR